MVATQYPEELRLAHTPSHHLQGNTQSQQNLHRVLPQTESQPGLVMAQQLEISTQNVSSNFGPKSNTNKGLWQRQHPNSACQAHVSSAARKDDSLGITTETFSFQHQCSLTKNKKTTSLLHALMEKNIPDRKSTFSTYSSLSHQTTAQLEVRTTDNFAGGSNSKGPPVRGSLASFNVERKRIQNTNDGGRQSGPHQHHVSASFFSSKPSKDDVSPAEDIECFNRRTLAFVTEKIELYQKTQPVKRDGQTSSTIVASSPTAVAAQAVGEHISKSCKENAHPTPESKEAGDCETSVSKKHSTEYPQIVREVAATSKRNEDESPHTATTVPGVTLDEPAEKRHTSKLDCNSSQEKSESLWLDINKAVDVMDQLPGVSGASKHTTEDQLARSIEPVDGVRLNHVHGVANVLEKLQTKLVPKKITFEPLSCNDHPQQHNENIEIAPQSSSDYVRGVITHSKLNLSIDIIQINDDLSVSTSQSEQLGNRGKWDFLSEGAGSVYSQADLSMSLNGSKVQERTGRLAGMNEEVFAINTVKNPEYEDISDDSQTQAVGEEAFAKKVLKTDYEDISDDGDTSQPATKLCYTHFEELSVPPRFEDIKYENISEDENSVSENVAERKPSLLFSSQVTKLTSEQMLCSDRQGLAQMKQENIPRDELTEKPVSPKTVLSDKAHCSSHSVCNDSDDGKKSVLCSSALLKIDNEFDEDSDDDWIVIPITISGLRYEPESEDQEGLEKVQLDDDEQEITEIQCNREQPLWPGPKPEATCPFSKMEVFETVDSFEQATEIHIIDKFEVPSCWSAPEHEVDYDGEPHVPQKRMGQYPESEDTCDTEDSCDYPSESQLNHMTVCEPFSKQSPTPPNPPPNVTVQETEGEQDKVTNGQTLNLNTIKERLHKIIQATRNIKQKTNGQSISSKTDTPSLESDSDGERDQRRRKKVKRKRRTRLSSDSSESKAELESAQHETEKHNTLNKGPIVIGSDLEDKINRSRKKRARRRLYSSTSEDRGDQTSIDQAAPQQQSTHHDEEMRETIQELCSDQQIETDADSESIQHITDRHKILNGPIILGSDSEDESNQNCKKEAKRRRLSLSSSMYKSDPTCIDQLQPQQQSKLHDEEFEGASSSKADSEPAQLKADIQKISTQENVIILSSDSDDDSDITYEKQNKARLVTSELADCHDTSVEQIIPSPEAIESKTAEVKRKETTLPPANSSLQQHLSNLHATQKNKTKQNMCSDLTQRGSGQQMKAKNNFENVHPKSNRQSVSEESERLTDADKELRRKHRCKRAAHKKRILSSSSEDSSSDTFCATEEILSPEPKDYRCVTATKKPENNRPSSEDSSKRQHQSMNRGTDFVRGSNPLLPRPLVSNSDQLNCRLKLQSSNVREKTMQYLNKSKKVQATVAKRPSVLRQFSLPNHLGLSTSNSITTSTCGPPTEARRSSVSPSGLPLSGMSREASTSAYLPRSKQSTSPPGQHLTSAKAQRSRSHSGPSTSNQLCSPTEGSSYSIPQPTRTKIMKDWEKSFPNKGERRRKKMRSGVRDNLGTTNDDSSREVRPGPSPSVLSGTARLVPSRSDFLRDARPGLSYLDPAMESRPGTGCFDSSREARPESMGRKRRARQRKKSPENTAPLMKKTRDYYMQLPKPARKPARKQSCLVGGNYKWRERTKGPFREGKQS
ncbi:uncharacterized protein LOC117804788 isoform X1 [Notolabrus celidotus]|uniref:uncharacterized protein LOC117804788 isoform X1 n=2 Tax=Notolabrus celidotus TaxID=1203425 RepID=UPI00149044F2|nr:uncharacterized protein LOC117804788 isoform X1 [Notolabrus celidotus]